MRNHQKELPKEPAACGDRRGEKGCAPGFSAVPIWSTICWPSGPVEQLH